MKKKSMGQKRADWPKLFGTFLSKLPRLTFRFGLSYLRIKRQSNKAGRKFEKELKRQGINKQKAKELTRIYLQPADIRSYTDSIFKLG